MFYNFPCNFKTLFAIGEVRSCHGDETIVRENCSNEIRFNDSSQLWPTFSTAKARVNNVDFCGWSSDLPVSQCSDDDDDDDEVCHGNHFGSIVTAQALIAKPDPLLAKTEHQLLLILKLVNQIFISLDSYKASLMFNFSKIDHEVGRSCSKLQSELASLWAVLLLQQFVVDSFN